MGQCCVAGNILSISQIIERAIMSAKHNNDVTSISVFPRNTDDYPTPKIYDENIDRMNLSDIEQKQSHIFRKRHQELNAILRVSLR